MIAIYNDKNGIVRDILFEKGIDFICILDETDLRKCEAQGFKTVLVDQEYEYCYSDRGVYNYLTDNGYELKRFHKNGDWVEIAINEGFTYSDIYDKWSFDENKKLQSPSLWLEKFDYYINLDVTKEVLIKQIKDIINECN